MSWLQHAPAQICLPILAVGLVVWLLVWVVMRAAAKRISQDAIADLDPELKHRNGGWSEPGKD